MWKRFNTGRKWMWNCSKYDVCWGYKNVTLCYTCLQTHMYMYMYIISTKSKLLIMGPSKLKKWNKKFNDMKEIRQEINQGRGAWDFTSPWGSFCPLTRNIPISFGVSKSERKGKYKVCKIFQHNDVP
jgi:hypothetical protein